MPLDIADDSASHVKDVDVNPFVSMGKIANNYQYLDYKCVREQVGLRFPDTPGEIANDAVRSSPHPTFEDDRVATITLASKVTLSS
jgi:hypothetical protein